MKAWVVSDKDYTTGSVIVYAETRGKAIAFCMHDEPFEYYEFTELRATRLKEFDQYYDGKAMPDIWWNLEHRIRLVKDYGWSCMEGIDDYCDDCPAKEWCRWWSEEEE